MTTQAALLESKEAVRKWAVLLLRALPECEDVEESVLVANLALESLPVDVELAIEDAQGNLHSEKSGEFVGKKGKDKPKNRQEILDALQKKKIQSPSKKTTSEWQKEFLSWTPNESNNYRLDREAVSARLGEIKAAKSPSDEVKKAILGEIKKYDKSESISVTEIEKKAKELDSSIEPDQVLQILHDALQAGDIVGESWTQPISNMDNPRGGYYLERPDLMLPSANNLIYYYRKPSASAFFAHDIENRRAQGILNRTIAISKKLTASARKDLEKSLRTSDPYELSQSLLKFIAKYRVQLADLLTTTQLASLLEGARDVAKNIPIIPNFPNAANPPATLEPSHALELLERLRLMDTATREEAIYKLPADQQTFARQGIMAQQQGGEPPLQGFVPQAVSGEPERIHYPIIDEAARELAEKNVMTREQFDLLDSAARQKAFTVAQVESMDTQTKIRNVMAETVKDGVDVQTFRERVLAAVDEGTFMSDAHLENVYRTNIQTAFSDGQMTVLSHPFVRSGFPYASIDPIDDDRARHNHLALATMGIQGTNIYRIDDPVFILFRSPWDYNCRCGWTAMSVRQAARAGIQEAITWIETGVEPTDRAFVPMPSFRPPPGFQRSLSGMPLSIQFSAESMLFGVLDDAGHEHKGKGEGGGQFTGIGEAGGKIGDVGEQNLLTFEKVKDAHKWGKDNFSSWASGLTKEEKWAVEAYSGGGYETINGELRREVAPEKTSGKTPQVISGLDAALAKGGLSEPIKIYRGVRGEFAESLIELAKTGGVFVDKSYMSGTIAKKISEEFSRHKDATNAVLEIDGKKGTPGAYIDALDITGEAEWLFPRGSKFKVTEAKKDETGKWRIKAEFVEDADKELSVNLSVPISFGVLDAAGHEHDAQGKFTADGGHVQAFEKIHERAGSDSSLTHADLDEFFDKLRGLNIDQLREIVAHMKWAPTNRNKRAILMKLESHVRELKHTYDTGKSGFGGIGQSLTDIEQPPKEPEKTDAELYAEARKKLQGAMSGAASLSTLDLAKQTDDELYRIFRQKLEAAVPSANKMDSKPNGGFQ